MVYTAHHDHLGHRRAGQARRRRIYNGAARQRLRRAPRCWPIAEAFAALPQRPRRSILFAVVAAEEQGLLGSRVPRRRIRPCPPGRIAANINIDGVNIWGRTARHHR